MTQTHLASALMAVTHDSSNSALAERSGIAQSTLSRMVTRGTRADPDTLRAICAQLDRLAAREILIAHIRDEITRAGYSALDIEITTPASAPEHLTIIARALEHDDNLRRIIADLADISSRIDAQPMLAADAARPYGRKK